MYICKPFHDALDESTLETSKLTSIDLGMEIHTNNPNTFSNVPLRSTYVEEFKLGISFFFFKLKKLPNQDEFVNDLLIFFYLYKVSPSPSKKRSAVMISICIK